MKLKNFVPISWLIVFVNAAAIHWDRLEHFCGSDISNFLSKHCLEVNDYRGGSDSYHLASSDGISNYCCLRRCSKRFMLEEFCKTPKDDTVQEMMKPPRPEPKKELKKNKIHAEPNSEAGDHSMEDIMLRPRSSKKQEMVSKKFFRGHCKRRRPRNRTHNCRNNREAFHSSQSSKQTKRKHKCLCCKRKNKPKPNEIPKIKQDLHGEKRSVEIGYDEGTIIPINTNSNDNAILYIQT